MNRKCIVAIFEDLEKAKVGVEVLEKTSLSNKNFTVISRSNWADLNDLEPPDTGNDNNRVETTSTNEMEVNTPGMNSGLGALVGGGVVAPIAISSLIFPLFAAGPLAGAAIGAIVGGLVDAEKTSDEPTDNIPSYEQRMSEGAILIVVTGTDTELRDAKASLNTCGPLSIKEAEISE